MHAEGGSSPVTAVFGFIVFLSFLFGAVQISLHLFASSAVSSAAFDAARSIAAEDGRTCDEARARARSQLGSYGTDPDVAITCSTVADDQVAVRIVAPSPAPLLDGRFDLGTIDRQAVILREEFRPGVAP